MSSVDRVEARGGVEIRRALEQRGCALRERLGSSRCVSQCRCENDSYLLTGLFLAGTLVYLFLRMSRMSLLLRMYCGVGSNAVKPEKKHCA